LDHLRVKYNKGTSGDISCRALQEKKKKKNYMFRPLEAIFRLHKVELGERDVIHIVCAMAYQW
jgi:hypothetical protein